MKKNIISTRKFPYSKALAVAAVFVLVALLFMFEKVAEVVVNTGNSAGINMPAVPLFRQAAGNMVLAGIGFMLLIFSALIIVPLVKFAVIGAGFALLGYGVYQLYKMFTGRTFQDVLPKK